MEIVKQGSIIKHGDNVDVAFEVMGSVEELNTGKYAFLGRWINIGYTEKGGWYISNPTTMTIPKSEFEDWLIMYEEAPVMRDSKWRNLKNRMWG